MSQTVSVQNSVETVCRDCIFAQWKEGEQCGCSLKVLNRFQGQGVEIKENQNAEGVKFFSIPGRVCVFCRPKTWATKKQLLTEKECAEEVRKEATLKCDAIIVLRPGIGLSIAAMTVKALQASRLPPSRLIFMVYPHIKASQIVHWAQKLEIPWQFEIIMEDECNEQRYIELAAQKSQATYFALFYAGNKPDYNFLHNIDHYLYDQLGRFLILKGVKEIDGTTNGSVYQRNLLKIFKGSFSQGGLEAIEKIAKEQECQHLIKEVVELVPAMKRS